MKKLLSRKLLIVLFSMPFFAIPFFISSSIDATIAPPTYQKCEEALLVPDNHFNNYGLADFGIPGKGVIRGTDKVLFFGDKQQLQCFCPQVGDIGTQSDWWSWNYKCGGMDYTETVQNIIKLLSNSKSEYRNPKQYLNSNY